jgi:hypothetical protein
MIIDQMSISAVRLCEHIIHYTFRFVRVGSQSPPRSDMCLVPLCDRIYVAGSERPHVLYDSALDVAG